MTTRRGTLKAFNAGAYTATVQIAGSLSLWLAAVPVSRAIPAAEMIAARTVAVAFFTDDNPSDAMIIGVN